MNMKHVMAPILAVALLFGHTPSMVRAADVSPPKEVISEITCKPGFDLKERQDIHVADAQGNQFDSFWQWIILDDGKQRFRIPWGSPPVSRGAATLSIHQFYTFTISTKEESNQSIHTVIRILKGKEVIYDAAAKKDSSRKLEQDKR